MNLLSALLNVVGTLLSGTSLVGGLPLLGGLTTSLVPTVGNAVNLGATVTQALAFLGGLVSKITDLVAFIVHELTGLVQFILGAVTGIVGHALCLVELIPAALNILSQSAIPSLTKCATDFEGLVVGTLLEPINLLTPSLSLDLVSINE